MVTYMLLLSMKLTEYINEAGFSPFQKWFDRLNSEAAAKITTFLYRLEASNFSNVEGVGKGVFEGKIHFGPGYRVYLGKEGEKWIILLGGGGKKGQGKDIKLAQQRWVEYKKR